MNWSLMSSTPSNLLPSNVPAVNSYRALSSTKQGLCALLLTADSNWRRMSVWQRPTPATRDDVLWEALGVASRQRLRPLLVEPRRAALLLVEVGSEGEERKGGLALLLHPWKAVLSPNS